MHFSRYSKTTLTTILGIFLFHGILFSQLNAGFTIDKPTGCSPLVVNFTNTSTGVSTNAQFEWDFGNGNHSILQNPGASFINSQVYTITLKVKDSGKTSVHSKIITVYKNPVINGINLSTVKGCFPLAVTLGSSALAGDGNITEYLWDFGDGFTQKSANSQVQHLYTAIQNPNINVSVTNSFGCQSTLENRNLQVLDNFKASFEPDKTFLCKITDAVTFVNNSKGPGPISAQWKFSDGNSSTQYSPSKVFGAKGAYDVSLVISNAIGCKDSITKTSLVNVANFATSFETNGILCSQESIVFRNTSMPSPTSSTWISAKGNAPAITSQGNDSVFNYYNNAVSDKVTLINHFGGCTDSVSKQITISPKPDLKGFVYTIAPCAPPFVVSFKDTMAGNVKWDWKYDYYNFLSDQEEFTHSFNNPSYNYVSLTATNAFGCSAQSGKYVPLQLPWLEIFSPETRPNDEIFSCGEVPLHFYAKSDSAIASYQWNFGDGSTSSDVTPTHVFTKFGEYKVSLSVVFTNGCSRTVEYKSWVVRRDRAKADFKISNTGICGNTPQTIYNLTEPAPYKQFTWDWGGAELDEYVYYNASEFNVKFAKPGTYTITMIATDLVCVDTVKKVNYITVYPPFPKIGPRSYTCEGTRGEVTFSQTTKGAITSAWNFGDGYTLTAGAGDSLVKHTYAKTGNYKVVLTTTNGACTVKDSAYIPVLLKQYPVLSADKTQVCTRQDFITLTYSNLEKNPWANQGDFGYNTYPWEHLDGSFAPGYVSMGTIPSTDTTRSLVLYDFEPGKEGLRSYVHTFPLYCMDTTNYIPLKITGPKPGFKQLLSDPCKSSLTVFLQDTTWVVDNVPIKSWEWDFGDGYSGTYTKPGIVTHKYLYPNADYPVYLTVTDMNGCSSRMRGWVNAVEKSVKATFIPSVTTISPNSTIAFSNTSLSSHPDETDYQWSFGDGTKTNTFDTQKTYTKPGTYRVQLIALNKFTGCSDTTSVNILVKYINAAFTIDPSYTSNSNCPPVSVSFTNLSSNASKVTWKFGDGNEGYDINNPVHIYTQPGRYIITLVTESDNGTKYTTLDSVLIKATSATLVANKYSGCNNQQITLSLHGGNTTRYAWDFGDGTVISGNDTIISHNYATGGIYQPAFIAMDSSGCAVPGKLPQKIIIDTLSVSLNNLPGKICSPKQMQFNPEVNSIAESSGQSLNYAWTFGTGNPSDTSNTKNPLFNFTKPGNYTIQLQVSSLYGCSKNAQAILAVFQGLGGIIQGPKEICEDATATFSGSTQIAGSPQWKWLFHDGTVVNQQNAPAKLYADSGIYKVQLVVDNNNCVDTVTSSLIVHGKPAFTITPHGINLCSGSYETITVNGPGTFSWQPATGLNTSSGNTVLASPSNNTVYTVQATSSFGCTGSDTVSVKVVQPFAMNVSPDVTICQGKSTQLTAGGAHAYQWINQTSSLSNTQVANPAAQPPATTTYTVVGTDLNHCFNDTANITVTVNPLPSVDAGTDIEVLSGNGITLQPTASSDVVRWQWAPPDYLSCNNCAAPVATPLTPVDYVVAVINAAGCIATDTLKVSLLCSGNKIYIPSGFTPNNDGLNDKFAIRAFGIKEVRYLKIYDRWGVLLFDRTNFNIGDQSASWDGNYNGLPLPSGSYVFMTELKCGKEFFVQKGTITLVR